MSKRHAQRFRAPCRFAYLQCNKCDLDPARVLRESREYAHLGLQHRTTGDRQSARARVASLIGDSLQHKIVPGFTDKE